MQKKCILPCLLQFYNKSWGSLSPFLTQKRLNLKLRVLLAVYIVSLPNYYVAQLTATCSSMIEQSFDSMILASTDCCKLVLRLLNELTKQTQRSKVFNIRPIERQGTPSRWGVPAGSTTLQHLPSNRIQ